MGVIIVQNSLLMLTLYVRDGIRAAAELRVRQLVLVLTKENTTYIFVYLLINLALCTHPVILLYCTTVVVLSKSTFMLKKVLR